MLHMLLLQEAFQFYMFALELQCKIYLLLCMGHNQKKNTLLMANPYVERLGGRLTYTWKGVWTIRNSYNKLCVLFLKFLECEYTDYS